MLRGTRSMLTEATHLQASNHQLAVDGKISDWTRTIKYNSLYIYKVLKLIIRRGHADKIHYF